MSELLRETINAAERVVAGEDSQVADYLERLLNSPGELRSGEDSERIYLAALLDFIGLHEGSARVLRDAPDAMSRNMEGMLAAAHGQHKQARNILVKALNAATDSPLLRKQILANLAAVSLRTGSVGEAEAWNEWAAAAGQAGNPAVDVLIATVRTSIASLRGDLPTLRSAAASLEEASKSRLAELGTEHPQALAVVANMATAEIMVARAENSAVRLERAIDVLEVAAVRLAAEFGADHPQAKAAMASLAAARAEAAPADAAVPATEQVTAKERQSAAAPATAKPLGRMSAKSGGIPAGVAAASSARRAGPDGIGLAVKIAARNDDDAVRRLYNKYRMELFRFGVHVLHDQGLAEEMVQETFIKFCQQAKGYDANRGPVRGWLFTMARSVAYDIARRPSSRPLLPVEDFRLPPQYDTVDEGAHGAHRGPGSG